MHTTRKMQAHEQAALWLLGVIAVLAAAPAGAQESMLAGLGWHKNSAGTQVDGSSQITVHGNRSSGPVVSTGCLLYTSPSPRDS